MSPAVEVAIANKEVVLDVTDIALVLALRLGAGGATRARPETIVPGEIDEARKEHDVAAATMGDHRALLIIYEHLARHAAEPFEGAHQRLIGMLAVLRVRAPEMKAARVAQRAH